ncbi:MAG: sigma-70 family RNA polymerase sigma factor [Bacteroidales bacterium]|nr:sigma-70 family RNA polymerase sigma factor [Bacteroidales bacterium]
METHNNTLEHFTAIVRQNEKLIKSIAAHFEEPDSLNFHQLTTDLATHLWLIFRDLPDTTLLDSRAWVYTTLYRKAINITRDEDRYQKHFVYGLDLTNLPEDHTSPDPLVPHLQHLINQLDDRDRETILMFIDGLSIDEIAAHLHKTKSQTYNRLHAIRNRLRRLNSLTNPDDIESTNY